MHWYAMDSNALNTNAFHAVPSGRRPGEKDEGNCSDLRGSADYWAHCGGATEHGISTANRFRPLKREQLRMKKPGAFSLQYW